jgi:hypothetical protein
MAPNGAVCLPGERSAAGPGRDQLRTGGGAATSRRRTGGGINRAINDRRKRIPGGLSRTPATGPAADPNTPTIAPTIDRTIDRTIDPVNDR